MENGKNRLRTENLSVGYGKKLLLSGVELDIRAGRVLTLIGPNGSGKSTILKTLTRQLKTMGGRIPEKIFTGGYVQSLYGISEECFNSLTGAMYPKTKKESPRVFVIGGGGSGITLYYRLFREGIPFAAGILFENDLEMDAARACASKVISVPAFAGIDERARKEAKECMEACETVLCPLTDFGPLNEANRELKEYASICGKLKTVVE